MVGRCDRSIPRLRYSGSYLQVAQRSQVLEKPAWISTSMSGNILRILCNSWRTPKITSAPLWGNVWAEWGARCENPLRSTSLSGDGASGTGAKPRGCVVLLIFQRLVAQTSGEFASELRANTLGSPRTEVSLGMRKTRPTPYPSREQDRSLCTLI